MKLREPYPPIEPFDTGRLRVSPLHELYYEQAGHPDGKPVIFLHGGPGAGIIPVYRQVFDPARYRIVLLDQRGCGRSTPAGELRENTTWDLVEDLEHLRRHLGITRWQVFGGSWGGTLALAYAQAHPVAVSEIVIRGPSMFRQADLDWEFGHAGQVWPEVWARFVGLLPESDRDNVLAGYWKLLNSEDAALRAQAAALWGEWEAVKCTMIPRWGEDFEDEHGYAAGLARLECHYCANAAFLRSDTQLFDDMPRIANIPGVIIQGRYDMITPVTGAWELARRWPAAELRILPLSGHSFNEPDVIHEMICATDAFADRR